MSIKNAPPADSASFRSPVTIVLSIAALVYLAAWGVHLYTGTVALRGFYGDGALAFLVHLSDSYVFGGSGRLVHLFEVGFPRDFQLLLNALGLQVALLLNVRDPAWLKSIFVFWQYALPGFLYLGLFDILRRKGFGAWAIFPLVSWAVLSVPVDWAATNSTRWAIPIFWMHFMLVMLSGPKLRMGSAVAAFALGAAMLGGLYESVMIHAALCVGLGGVMWMRGNNRVPFIYALAAVPGACRAFFSYLSVGRYAPNDFHGLILPLGFSHVAYSSLILLTLALIAIVAVGTGRIASRFLLALPLLLIFPALQLWFGDVPSPWVLMEMRFDYAFLSLGLMALAGGLRVAGVENMAFAPVAAIIALSAGSVLWITQIHGTREWQICRASGAAEFGAKPLLLEWSQRSLFAPDPKITFIPVRGCEWSWAEPWTMLLLAKGGQVKQWPLFSFWQDFSFIKKDGQVFLHTNNWTLTSPSTYPSSGDLPLKTLLYDLTPLYQKVGDGDLFHRARCLPPEEADSYWQGHLLMLDDARREAMHACPRDNRLHFPL